MRKYIGEKYYQNFTVMNLLILIVAAVLLLVYWWLHEYAGSDIKNSYLALLCKELGMAGLIALILNLSIEFVNRKRHSEDKEELISLITRELFKAVYGRSVDKSIVNQLDNYLFSSVCIRRNYVDLIQLSVIESAAEPMATLSSNVSYCIENITSKRVKIPIVKCSIDNSHSEGLSSFKKMCIDGKEFKDDELKKFLKIDSHGRSINLYYDDYLEPMASVKVSYEFVRTVYARNSEAIVTTIPMDSFRLTVLDRSDLFKIDAFSLHPVNEKLVTSTVGLKEWIINDSIIPGQGLLLTWELASKNNPSV